MEQPAQFDSFTALIKGAVNLAVGFVCLALIAAFVTSGSNSSEKRPEPTKAALSAKMDEVAVQLQSNEEKWQQAAMEHAKEMVPVYAGGVTPRFLDTRVLGRSTDSQRLICTSTWQDARFPVDVAPMVTSVVLIEDIGQGRPGVSSFQSIPHDRGRVDWAVKETARKVDAEWKIVGY